MLISLSSYFSVLFFHLEHFEKNVEKPYNNLKPLLFGYILERDLLSGQGTPPILVLCMVLPSR